MPELERTAAKETKKERDWTRGPILHNLLLLSWPMVIMEALYMIGQIIEANTGFLHSSDLDPSKPINWKRMTEFNGEYGVLGDLGLHALHVPYRAGWRPRGRSRRQSGGPAHGQ